MLFRLALLLMLFLCPEGSYSQNIHYDIVNYTTDNGLPQNSITEIHFDRKGYCWLGTEMGIVRFDGARFKVFGSENISGLRSERVRAIGADLHKNTFVEMANGQILTTEMPGVLSAPQPRVTESNVWLSSHNNLAVAMPFESKITDSLMSSLKYGGVEQLRVGTRSGSLYLVVNNKTYYVTKNSIAEIDSRSRSYNKDHAVMGDRLVILQPGGKVKSWLGGVQQKHRDVVTGPVSKNPHYLNDTYVMLTGETGNYIYAGTTLYGLYFEGNQFRSRVLLEHIDIENLSVVYYHKEQRKYYLGSLTSGLYVVSPSLFQYPSMPEQAIKDGFRSQVAVEGGKGIVCERYLYRKTGSVVLPINRHIGATAFADNRDQVYYGMTAELFRFNLKTSENKKMFELDSRPSAIIRDRTDSNCILLATSLSVGKMYGDTLKMSQKVPGRKAGKAIWGLTQIGKDTFLLSTQEGLKWYDFKANRIFHSVLDSLVIHSVYPDTANRIWISTYGRGFFLYADGRITSLPSGPSNALKAVHAFIDDGKGNFWLPTNNGLYTTRKDHLLAYAAGKVEDVYYYSFSTRNGLRSNEFNGGSIPNSVWLQDSMLSLLSIQGPVWFYPHMVHLLLPDKGIYLEYIRIGETEVLHTGGPLVLAPDHGRISLKVSSPYFGNRENMQLQFKIEGLDEKWQSVPENGDILIERIPAGTFSLVLRKNTGKGPGEYVHLQLPIQVKPYWYNTWPFFLALFLLSAVCIYQVIRLRTRLLHKRNRRLKTLVALQTRDLNHMIRQLTQSEDALKQSNQTKDNIITTVLHDLRSPIRFIYTISKHLVSDHRGMQQDTLESHLVELKNGTASLNSFTDQFFTWALSQHRSFAARYSWESLAGLFQETETLYGDIMGANDNRLIVVPTSLYCYTDPQLLSAILRNLLDNANKNTSKGVVTLAAARSEDQVIITVNDTGKGFKPEALRAFLDKNKSDPRNGRGSFIILYLLELIGGRLEAESEPGRGTEFRVVLFHQNAAPGNRPGG